VEWLPIESAPKDGTEIVAAKESTSFKGWKVLRFPYPLRSRYVEGRWLGDFGACGWLQYEPQPTHWAPCALTAPPSAEPPVTPSG
jgi:hypothetical protein